jgi:hypothetical protein
MGGLEQNATAAEKLEYLRVSHGLEAQVGFTQGR